MREVVISQTVQDKIDELEVFLKTQLKMSKEAAKRRCDRMDVLFLSLGDYPLCRFKKWRLLGYRCVSFERDWVFAYEIFDDGVIIRDMSHVKLLKD